MQHFIRYDRRTGEIVGHLTSSREDIAPQPRSDQEEVVEVTSDDDKQRLKEFNPLTTRLRGRVDRGALQLLAPEPIYKGQIALTIDRADDDGDGRPELPADGKSSARVTATIVGSNQKPIDHRARVSFSVTRGALSARAVEAASGVASVDWKAPAETVQARITARADGFQEASLTVEFIPADEHSQLASRKTT